MQERRNPFAAKGTVLRGTPANPAMAVGSCRRTADVQKVPL